MRVETPRFGFVKRRDDGSVDFVSPIPCPFHYGSVPGTLAADGAPLDALVLGEPFGPGPVERGTELLLDVFGEVRFVDAGLVDTKLITARRPPTRLDRWTVRGFFSVYARMKWALNRTRGARGETRVEQIVWDSP